MAIAFVAVLPIGVESLLKIFVVRRPYWAFFFDPEVSFFYDGVRLLQCLPPLNIFHPGGPTHFLSAMLVLLTTRNPLEVDLFRRLGYFVILLGVYLGAVLLQKALPAGTNPAIAVSAVWFWFAFPTVPRWTTVVTTEALYLPFGAAVILAVVAYERRHTVGSAGFVGLALGGILALKFLFLAWFPAAVVAVVAGRKSSNRDRALRATALVAGCGAGFVVFTLPCWRAYGFMVEWVTSLATRSGEYATGPKSTPGIRDLTEAVLNWLRTAKAWNAVALVLCGAVLAALVRAARTRQFDGVRIAVFGLLAAGGCSAAILRASGNVRYVMPVGLALIGVFVGAVRMLPAWNRPARALATAILIGGVHVRSLAQDYALEVETTKGAAELQAAIRGVLKASGIDPDKSCVVYSFRSPDPAFALRVFASQEETLAAIEGRYPRTGHYVPWSRTLVLPKAVAGWDALVVTKEDAARLPFSTGRVLGEAGGFVILGPVGSRETPKGGGAVRVIPGPGLESRVSAPGASR